MLLRASSDLTMVLLFLTINLSFLALGLISFFICNFYTVFSQDSGHGDNFSEISDDNSGKLSPGFATEKVDKPHKYVKVISDCLGFETTGISDPRTRWTWHWWEPWLCPCSASYVTAEVSIGPYFTFSLYLLTISSLLTKNKKCKNKFINDEVKSSFTRFSLQMSLLVPLVTISRYLFLSIFDSTRVQQCTKIWTLFLNSFFTNKFV